MSDIRLDKIRKLKEDGAFGDSRDAAQRLQHLYLSLRQKLGGKVVITDMEHAVPALKEQNRNNNTRLKIKPKKY